MNKPEVVSVVREYVLRPGDEVPEGRFIRAWSLNPRLYGEGAFCIQMETHDG